MLSHTEGLHWGSNPPTLSDSGAQPHRKREQSLHSHGDVRMEEAFTWQILPSKGCGMTPVNFPHNGDPFLDSEELRAFALSHIEGGLPLSGRFAKQKAIKIVLRSCAAFKSLP